VPGGPTSRIASRHPGAELTEIPGCLEEFDDLLELAFASSTPNHLIKRDLVALANPGSARCFGHGAHWIASRWNGAT